MWSRESIENYMDETKKKPHLSRFPDDLKNPVVTEDLGPDACTTSRGGGGQKEKAPSVSLSRWPKIPVVSKLVN